jgi:3-oxoacyl-[acyl-carrier-protein] synthase-3
VGSLQVDDTGVLGARIAGLGAARPGAALTGAELVAPFGKTAEWLRSRTGIEQVRRLAADEDVLDLTTVAAQAALADAATPAENVDLVLVATCSASPVGEEPLSARLGGRLAPAAVRLDVNAACAGFCYALSAAAGMISTGAAHTALVVGAERMSALLDPADLGTSVLFGDGAGAAVITAASAADGGVGPAVWTSDGSRTDVLEIREDDAFLRMAGQRVFRWAVDEVPKVAVQAIAAAGVRAADIDVFVPHQANLRIIEAVRRKLDLEHAVTAVDVSEAGNTSGASIPIALSTLRRAGQARTGQLALLVGFGAGLTIAAQVVVLP